MRGEGSGFIISSDGLILTNAHVVQDAKEVTVKLTDRREYQAKVLGADPQTDVAVLKIEAKNLPVVKTGDVNQLQVGEWVLAIGSPYGLENTATAGIVSAKGRSLPDDTSVPFIQTDVAVNPGNSGGPLFNDRGEVVGINSQIYSRTGGFQGLSFSIPIDVAYKIKDQILEHGKVQHARLGVTVQEVNQTWPIHSSWKRRRARWSPASKGQRRRTRRPAAGRCGAADQRQDHRVVRRPGVDDHAGLARRQAQAGCLAQWLAKELSATLGGVPKDKATASSDTRTSSAGSWAWRCARSVRRSSASPAPRVCSSSSPPALPPRPAYSRATCCCR